MRQFWSRLDYLAVISYRTDIFTLSKFEGVYRCGPYDTLRVEIGNRFPLIKDEVTGVFYICSAIKPVFVG